MTNNANTFTEQIALNKAFEDFIIEELAKKEIAKRKKETIKDVESMNALKNSHEMLKTLRAVKEHRKLNK